MDDPRADDSAEQDDPDQRTRAERRRAWERALDGPPINPRTELIYHDDGKKLQSRHS